MSAEANTMSGCRILVADDEPVQLEIMRNMVEAQGVTCETAFDGQMALGKLLMAQPGYFDLVFLDVHMPGLDGFEVAQRFRASGRSDAVSLPILGISADVDPMLYGKAINVNMNGMALKPLSADTMKAYITLFVKEKRTSGLFQAEGYSYARHLREERDNALASERAKSYFFSTVSHDIRTPLNAIIGFAELLKGGIPDPEERARALESIVVSGQTLLRLVNDILDLSKLEAGRMAIQVENCDFGHLVEEVVGCFERDKINSHLVLRTAVQPMPPLMVDPQRIRQILFNLVGNAVKFTERGHIEVRASYTPVTPDVGTLVFDVEDTGCGISPEDQNRLMTPYVQLSEGMKKGGTGLGLAICHQLLNAMNGTIQIASVPKVGSTFTVTIPRVVRAADPLTPERSPSASADAVDAACVRRVLVVDDATLNIMVLRSMLKRLGVREVVTAENGRDAFGKLKKELSGGRRIDLILTDIWMPEMDGVAFVKALRADPCFCDIPTYAVTADVEAKNTMDGHGFSGILFKPLALEHLANLLKEVGR